MANPISKIISALGKYFGKNIFFLARVCYSFAQILHSVSVFCLCRSHRVRRQGAVVPAG